MKIWIIEDDHLQAGWLNDELEEHFSNCDFTIIRTERGFRSRFKRLKNNVPDLLIMDLMVVWDIPRPSTKPLPDDVRNESFYTAGVRCINLMLSDKRTRAVPIIAYTIVPESDLDLAKLWDHKPAHIIHLRKDGDTALLVKTIRSLLQDRNVIETRESGILSRLWNATEAKIEGFGVSLDLKKLIPKRKRRKGS